MKENKKYSIVFFLMFFFLIKPDYFSYIGTFNILYNLGFICTVIFILLATIRKGTISKVAVLILGIIIFPVIIGGFCGEKITYSLLIPVIQTVGITLLLNIGIRKNFSTCLSMLALVLELYTYINFATIILFPNGLYEATFYSGNYWFLGYKNVMIRFLLPSLFTNAVLSVYRKGKYSIRLYCLILISILTLVFTDCKTSLIGVIVMLIIMFLFSKEKLPRFVNLKNGIIIFIILTIALSTTHLLDSFSSILTSMGETVSVFSRQAVWKRGMEMFAQSPIFGYGLRSNDTYRSLINLSTGWGYFSHPHNFYIYTLIQGGLIEIILIMSLIVNVSKKCYKIKDNFGAKALVGMYAAFFVMGTTESLSGSTLLYPMMLFVEAFLVNDIRVKRNNHNDIKFEAIEGDIKNENTNCST